MTPEPAQRRPGGWIHQKRYRYKAHPTLPLAHVRDDLKTGDIILFHKTSRSGILDTLEMDVLAPLFFPANEFRHSGIIVREGDSVSVVECTNETHSGHAIATYPTGGKGIRVVPLEPLLDAYKMDNGDPHFGVRFIGESIAADTLMSVVKELGPVAYLKGSRSIPIWVASLLLPARIRDWIIAHHASEMMCSEFVHAVLAKCGALHDYPSKVFAPYIIENAHLFARHDRAGYSDIVRFVV